MQELELSWGDVESCLKCRACFWLKERHKVNLPGQPWQKGQRRVRDHLEKKIASWRRRNGGRIPIFRLKGARLIPPSVFRRWHYRGLSCKSRRLKAKLNVRLSDCLFFVGSHTPFAPLAFSISDYNFDSTVAAIFRAFDAQAWALEANGRGRRKFGYCLIFSFRRVPLSRRRASFALLREELRLVAMKVHRLKPERARRLFREAVRVARLSKQPPHSKNCVRFGFRPNPERLVS